MLSCVWLFVTWWPPCPSSAPKVYSDSCPLSWWCHPTISSSVVPFSHLQSFPAPGSFQMSQFFVSGGQRIGVSVSASVLPVNIQDWFLLGWTDWIFLQSNQILLHFILAQDLQYAVGPDQHLQRLRSFMKYTLEKAATGFFHRKMNWRESTVSRIQFY